MVNMNAGTKRLLSGVIVRPCVDCVAPLLMCCRGLGRSVPCGGAVIRYCRCVSVTVRAEIQRCSFVTQYPAICCWCCLRSVITAVVIVLGVFFFYFLRRCFNY